jgi:hypothetical protein
MLALTDRAKIRSGKVPIPTTQTVTLTPGEAVVLKVARELIENLLTGDDIDCDDACTE